jgi:hypothetical protein
VPQCVPLTRRETSTRLMTSHPRRQKTLHAFQQSRAELHTVQLTVSQSVSLGVEPNLGLLTRDIFFFKLQSCLIWGALSDERSGLSFVSLLSIQSVVVSVFTYIIYILCYTHFTIKYNTIQYNTIQYN